MINEIKFYAFKEPGTQNLYYEACLINKQGHDAIIRTNFSFEMLIQDIDYTLTTNDLLDDEW